MGILTNEGTGVSTYVCVFFWGFQCLYSLKTFYYMKDLFNYGLKMCDL